MKLVISIAVSLVLAGCLTLSGTYQVVARDPATGKDLSGARITAGGSAIYSVRNALCMKYKNAVILITDAKTGDELKSESPYTCPATYSVEQSIEVPERWMVNFDGRPWQVGYQAADGRLAVREYVLPGETVHAWTELVTSLYAMKNISVNAWFEEFKKPLSQRCPSSRFLINEESTDNLIYEWQHDGCLAEPMQHEIRRLTRGRKGMLSLSYGQKTRMLAPETRDAWLSIIRTATIKPDA